MADYNEDRMIPEPDYEKKEETRQLFLTSFEQCRMTDVAFIVGQIRFIRTKMWIGQFMTLILLSIFANWYMKSVEGDYFIGSFISSATPVFIVFQLDELAGFFKREMLELEGTTRFSIKKQFLSRMIILGITDLFFMTNWIFILHVISGKSFINLLLYTLVPFNITVIGLFFLLNFVGEGYAYHYMALSYMAFVCGVFTVLPRWQKIIYAPDHQFLWIILFVISMVLCICMIGRVWYLFSDNNGNKVLRERNYYGSEY